nr:unnamed protein product [Naegleria fowleri]
MMNHILPIANAYVSILSNFNNTESIFTLLPRQLERVIGNDTLQTNVSIFEGVRLSVIGIGFLFILTLNVLFMGLIYQRRNPKIVAKCSSCCSLVLLFWVFLFVAASICVWMVIVPSCHSMNTMNTTTTTLGGGIIDLLDPQRLPTSLQNTSFSMGLNMTRGLLQCQEDGITTWMEVIVNAVAATRSSRSIGSISIGSRSIGSMIMNSRSIGSSSSSSMMKYEQQLPTTTITTPPSFHRPFFFKFGNMHALNQYIDQVNSIFQIANSTLSTMIPLFDSQCQEFNKTQLLLIQDMLKNGIEQPMKDISNLFLSKPTTRTVLDDLNDLSTYSSQFNLSTFNHLIQQLNAITKNITTQSGGGGGGSSGESFYYYYYYYDVLNISKFSPFEYPFNSSQQYSELMNVYVNQHLSTNITLYQQLTSIQSQLLLYTQNMMNLTQQTLKTVESVVNSTLSNTRNGMNRVISNLYEMNQYLLRVIVEKGENNMVIGNPVKNSLQTFTQYLKGVFSNALCGYMSSAMSSIQNNVCQVMHVGTIGMSASAILIACCLVLLYPIGLIASKRFNERFHPTKLWWNKSPHGANGARNDMAIQLLEERANELTIPKKDHDALRGFSTTTTTNGDANASVPSTTTTLTGVSDSTTTHHSSNSRFSLIKGSKQRYAYSGVGEGDSDGSGEDEVKTFRKSRNSKKF